MNRNHLQYYCELCNKPLGKNAFVNKSRFCKSCSHILHKENCGCASCKSKRGELSKENHGMFKHGKTFAVAFCENCGKKLHRQAVLYNNKKCIKCAGKQHGLIYRGEKSPVFIDGRSSVDHFCKNKDCKNKISYFNFHSGQHTCKQCYLKTLKIPENNPMFDVHRFGEDNPNWQGGIQHLPYAFEWNEELKLKIRDRDNYICQNSECNMIEQKHLELFNTNLIVPHIDYNKLNCLEKNLITLCNICNIKANYNRNYWEQYYTSKIQATIPSD